MQRQLPECFVNNKFDKLWKNALVESYDISPRAHFESLRESDKLRSE